MSYKPQWTTEEEQMLQTIRARNQKNNWSEIAQELNKTLKGKKKNGKQCRERYINHIQFQEEGGSKPTWSAENQKTLYQQFEKLGPRWSQITKWLPGNPQNTIKNKFYSGVRRLVKVLNNVIEQKNLKQIKPVKYESLIRILRYTENYWESYPQHQEQCNNLKKILISIMKDQNLEPSEALTLSIINRIHMFNSQIRCFIMRNSKRKGTKKRRKNGFSKKQQGSKNPEDPTNVSESQKQSSKEESFNQSVPSSMQMDDEQYPNLELSDYMQKDKNSSRVQEFDKQICEILNEEYVPPHASLFQ